MKHRHTAFYQLLKLLPRQRFQALVDRQKGDHITRVLRCWDQLIAMLFCQLSGRQSLCDFEDGFNSKNAHYYYLDHLCTGAMRRSSVSAAKHQRPVAMFQQTLFY